MLEFPDNERWCEIPGAAGYQVSEYGRIIGRRGKILRCTTQSGPYAGFSVGKRGKTMSVHSAVLLAFVGPCPEGQEVRHLNGNFRDNRLSNLQYGTHKENLNDRDSHGTTSRGTTQPAHKLTDSQICEIRSLVGTYSQREIARQYGISQNLVHGIITRKRWSHVS